MKMINGGKGIHGNMEFMFSDNAMFTIFVPSPNHMTHTRSREQGEAANPSIIKFN